MATCLVSGTLQDIAGEPVTDATVCARVLSPKIVGNAFITPYQVEVATDSSGNFAITLAQSLSVVFVVKYPVVGTEPFRTLSYTGNIPATATASFSDVIEIE